MKITDVQVDISLRSKFTGMINGIRTYDIMHLFPAKLLTNFWQLQWIYFPQNYWQTFDISCVFISHKISDQFLTVLVKGMWFVYVWRYV